MGTILDKSLLQYTLNHSKSFLSFDAKNNPGIYGIYPFYCIGVHVPGDFNSFIYTTWEDTVLSGPHFPFIVFSDCIIL